MSETMSEINAFAVNSQRAKAFAYYRTSSATNVGADKDSLARQQSAVKSYASAHHVKIVGEYYDGAISGADPIEGRPGFASMLEAIASNGVRAIIVETANRFARDLIVQETGWRFLRGQGIDLIAADSPKAFLDDTPTAVLIRQILGAVAQFEKASLVAKLAAARKRTGRHGGKTPLSETRPDVQARIVQLRRDNPDMPLRAIGEQLASEGMLTSTGETFGPSTIALALRRVPLPAGKGN